MASSAQQPKIEAAPRRVRFSLSNGALAVLVCLALPLLWRAFATLQALLAYRFPHDGLEGTLLYEARLLWAGDPLYQPLEPLRFISAPYPPLHPLMLGLFDQFAGPH